MADVRLTGVEKAYGDTRILHGIDLEIRDGEFMVFVGPSGCGKSTLLRSIAGLEEITGGTLTIGGRVVNDVPPAERGIAMVFQSYALYPHMNLFDNMAFGLKLAKVPKAEIETAVRAAAKILHIEHLLDRKPKDLSGGQRQRLTIARAILMDRPILVLDEPTAATDPENERAVNAALAELMRGRTVIVVAHRLPSIRHADQILVLERGQLAESGTHDSLLAVDGLYAQLWNNHQRARLWTLGEPQS